MRTPLLLITAMMFGLSQTAWAFCGFYVAGPGSTPFNESSKVVLARHGSRTAITMSSDISNNPAEFALVIPVPVTVQRNQVRVIQSATIDHLDAYSVPRLVEYFDPDPCALPMAAGSVRGMPVPAPPPIGVPRDSTVRVEAEYSVGEYDIQVLSAGDSSGLIAYLNQRNYRIPEGAAPVINSYLGQHMQFFVAKVNVKRLSGGTPRPGQPTYLRPIQVEYESAKFMLPIRLGTVNAHGAQDMTVLAITDHGRVETTNYQTRRMPTGVNVPTYVKDDFNTFYRAVFERQVQDAEGSATFLEYAWSLGNCDPCSSTPMTNDELRELGATWLVRGDGSMSQPAFITRLHVRYDREHFPEDLALQETRDTESYQARYVVNHPFTGGAECRDSRQYRAGLPERFRREARNLVELTNWSYDDVRAKMEAAGTKLP